MPAVIERYKGRDRLQPRWIKGQHCRSPGQKEQVQRHDDGGGTHGLNPLQQRSQSHSQSRAEQCHQRQNQQDKQPVDPYRLDPAKQSTHCQHQHPQGHGRHEAGQHFPDNDSAATRRRQEQLFDRARLPLAGSRETAGDQPAHDKQQHQQGHGAVLEELDILTAQVLLL